MPTDTTTHKTNLEIPTELHDDLRRRAVGRSLTAVIVEQLQLAQAVQRLVARIPQDRDLLIPNAPAPNAPAPTAPAPTAPAPTVNQRLEAAIELRRSTPGLTQAIIERVSGLNHNLVSGCETGSERRPHVVDAYCRAVEKAAPGLTRSTGASAIPPPKSAARTYSAAIARVRQLRSSTSLNYRQIAAILTDEGFAQVNGLPWGPDTARNTARSAVR